MTKGKIIVISAPSGGGKSTIISKVMERINNLHFSISVTTRAPRGKETHGVEYFFLSQEEFEDKIRNNEFAEYKNVYGRYYGTLKSFVDSCIKEGKNTIFDLDVQGAMAIKESYPECLSIFIYPPSMEILKERLIKRSTDSLEDIEKRLSFAETEIARKDEYDYTIKNDKLDDAVNKMLDIFKKNSIF